MVAELERYPCHVCGALIVRPHNSFECAWRLRDEVRQLRRELVEARAELAVCKAMETHQ